jgi:hypothetical protein
MYKPLLCVAALIAALSTEPLHAQQDGPNYPVLTIVFAVGAVGSFVVFKNTHTCSGTGVNGVVNSPGQETNCDAQQSIKDGALGVGILCTVGFVWSLLHVNRTMSERSGALITTAPHKVPVIQPPDFSYSAPRHDLRVLLVHAAF